MAKVKITNYVKTLHQLLAIGDQQTQQQNFVGYLKLLKKHKQLKNINEILSLYQKELNNQTQTIQAFIYYQDQMPDKKTQEKIKNFLINKFQAKHIDLIMKQKSIGLGYIIEANDHFFDFTLDTQLTKFKQKLLET